MTRRRTELVAAAFLCLMAVPGVSYGQEAPSQGAGGAGPVATQAPGVVLGPATVVPRRVVQPILACVSAWRPVASRRRRPGSASTSASCSGIGWGSRCGSALPSMATPTSTSRPARGTAPAS